MEIDKLLDILDKWEFFLGQRAGRELWASKPTEVQNEDIADFCRGLGLVREALKQQRWIPVSERLPKENEPVLFWASYYGRWATGYFDRLTSDNAAWFDSDEGDAILSGTHWLPLPEPPKEGGCKE